MKALFQTLTVAMMLSLAFVAVQVEAKDLPDPSATPEVDESISFQSFSLSKNCAYVIGFKVDEETQDAIIADRIKVIQAATREKLDSQDQPRDWSEIQERKLFDQLAAALSSNKPPMALKSAMATVSPIYLSMLKSVQDLTDAQANLGNQDRETETGKAALKRYKDASAAFGRQYGAFSVLMKTLYSVKGGNGARADTPINKIKEKGGTVIYALDTDEAEALAKEVWSQLGASARAAGIPIVSIFAIDKIFKDNVFAQLADAEQDQSHLADIGWWDKFVGSFWLRMSQNRLIKANSSLRQFMLTVTKFPYEGLMLYKYLGKIQEVVDLAVVVNKKGSVTVNPDTIDEALAKLIEYNKGTDYRNDFLLTFAQISEHSGVYQALMKAAWKKSKDVGKYDDSYKKLLRQMKTAKDNALVTAFLDTTSPHDFPDQLQASLTTLGVPVITTGSGIIWKVYAAFAHGLNHDIATKAPDILKAGLKASGL